MDADRESGAPPLEEDPAETLDPAQDATSPSPQERMEEEPEAPVEPAQPEAPPPLVALEEVSKSYGPIHALGPLTLTLDGTCVGILGPNGAGKTTLLRILMGLLPPTSGTVRVLGQEVRDRSIRQRIGYAPEGEAMFPHLSGVQAVAYAGRLVGMPATDAMQRAHQVLDYVELGEARYRPASTYSTGMRQRLKLAQALVHDPELLILDEPTEGVDPQAREELLTLISELAKEHGLRVLLSTHLLADVERLASHALVVDQGQVVAHGTLDELQRAGTRGYVVRVTGDPQPLVDRLERDGVAFQSTAPMIRIELEDPKHVLRLVEESGLVVRHLAPVRLRLEEAFEQAVGGGGAPA